MKQYAPMLAVLFGLMLVAKRSPSEMDQWLGQVMTFITDPENFAGLVLVALGVGKRSKNGSSEASSAVGGHDSGSGDRG